MKKCYQGGNRHKFQPRYTEEPLYGIKINNAWGMSVEELRSFLVQKIYVHDVCEWCGKIIPPQTPDSEKTGDNK